MYGKYCGVPKQKIDICPTVGWIRDFADPLSVLYPTFYGPSIVPTNNSNWGQTNDPAINAAMQKAALVVDPTARAQAWANVDKMLVDQAVCDPRDVREPAQHREQERRRGQPALERRHLGLRLHLAEVVIPEPASQSRGRLGGRGAASRQSPTADLIS